MCIIVSVRNVVLGLFTNGLAFLLVYGLEMVASSAMLKIQEHQLAEILSNYLSK